MYATHREDPAQAVNRFYHYIDRAVLTNVRIDWGGSRTSDVHPTPVPDLFASHPIILHGKIDGTAAVAPTLTAQAGERVVKIPVSVRRTETAGGLDAREVLGLLWARSKVATLERDLWDGQNPEAQNAITRLGLDFHLVTRFTSFVAVDTSRKVAEAATGTIVQPVEQPEGVDVTKAGGTTIAPSYGASENEASDAPPAPTDKMEVQEGMRRGCGCRAARTDRTTGAIWLSFAIAVTFWLRRRIRRPTA